MPQTWLITGCSRGLGKALTQLVLESGDFVAATARRPEQLGHFIDQYGADRVLALGLDVSNETQVFEAVSKAHDKFGRIDILVNNAGYAETASIEDVSLNSFRSQIETNFLGPVYVTKAVLPIMRQQGSGHILQVSSVGGRVGSPGLGGYQSAKWAIGGFSTVLSQEVQPFGIKVTVLEPGGIRTDWGGAAMGQGLISEPYKQTVGAFKAFRESLIPNQTPPEKIAKAILHVSREKEPPLRLLLGADAFEYGMKMGQNLAASDAKWRDVSVLSGF